MTGRPWAAAGAGVLTANALPHAYAAVTGSRQMIPLGGARSGPLRNGAWAALQALAAGVLACRTLADAGDLQRCDVKTGVLAVGAWSLLSEFVITPNGPSPCDGPR